MDTRYNILFYFTDQQRADTCGCYGQRLDVTPCLDALAKEGTVFQSAISPQPVCGPARAIFQTGKCATELGCFRNSKMLPLTVKTLANYMEGAGYETGYVGKWHLASEGNLEAKPYIDYQRKPIPRILRGGYTGFWRASDVLEFTSNGYGGYIFDENENRIGFKKYRADFIAEQALEFLERYDGKRPFFLTVSQIEPHHQNDAGHYQGPEGSKDRFKNFEVPADLAAFPEGDWKSEYPDYLGAVHSCDWNFGRLIRKLKELDIYDKTIIVYTSDHGSHFRTRNHDAHMCGYDDYKRTCHEAAVHVPLVITGGPFCQGGKRIKEVVSTASLPKTFVHLAGYEVGDAMIGEELDFVAKGNLPANRVDEAFIQISESRVARCVRGRRYVYEVVAPGVNGGSVGSADHYVDDFLYDLQEDPNELHNLIGDSHYDSIRLMMREHLLSLLRQVEHAEPLITDR